MPTDRFRVKWPEWLFPRFYLPSWLLSLGLHAVFFVLIALFLQRGGRGDGKEQGRLVHIVEKLSDDSTEQEAEPATDAESEPVVPPTEPLLPDTTATENLLDLPESLPVIGAAAPEKPGAVSPLRNLQPPGAAVGGRVMKPGKGETRFMGILDSGMRFVYVVDYSGSMGRNNAITVAKDELNTSLSFLGATQQFGVIFYNLDPHQFVMPGKKGLYYSTEANLNRARDYIDRQNSPNGGTDHMPALRLALSLAPEVIYFLTDAANPVLSAADLDEIRRANRGGARIHAIEFGIGPPLPASVPNFLKRLARANNGTYRYRDVIQFRTTLPGKR